MGRAGSVPHGRIPSVLVSTRLSEVRGFSDFFSEFFQVQAVPAMTLLLDMQASQSAVHEQFDMSKTELTFAHG